MASINWIKATLTGRLGEVVGSSWKGIPYVKTFTPPSNPKTEAQRGVRSVFGNVSHIASAINRCILRPYTYPKPKKMSAYNKMVEINQPMIATKEWDPSKLKIFDGPAITTSITKVNLLKRPDETIAVVEITVINVPDIFATDILVGVVYDDASGRAFCDIASFNTSSGNTTITVVTDGTFNPVIDNLHIYTAYSKPPVEGEDLSGVVSGTAYFKPTVANTTSALAETKAPAAPDSSPETAL